MSAAGMEHVIIATQISELGTDNLEWALICMIARAKELGKVITIECVPQQPLAMRNYVMTPHVRDAR